MPNHHITFCREYSVVEFSTILSFPSHGNKRGIGAQSEKASPRARACHRKSWRIAPKSTAPISVRWSVVFMRRASMLWIGWQRLLALKRLTSCGNLLRLRERRKPNRTQQDPVSISAIERKAEDRRSDGQQFLNHKRHLRSGLTNTHSLVKSVGH